MKKRIISGIVLALIGIPLIIKGGSLFNYGVLILGLGALYEFLKIKKDDIPLPVKIISYFLLSYIILYSQRVENLVFVIDFRVMSLSFLLLVLPIIFTKNKVYNIEDALYTIGGVFLISLSLNTLIRIRSVRMAYAIYIILVSGFTDVFAYFVGGLIGKRRLNSLSPKKTLEGAIGGTLAAGIVASNFYYMVIGGNLLNVILLTVVLSIIGQFGDLLFSAIKRYYKVKDFSDLIPGHGGILDRIDGLIFILLGYILFLPFF